MICVKKLILALSLVAGMAHAATWERPSGGYTPTNHSINTTKYQTDRANNVAISSVKVDGDLNKAFQGLNDIEDRTPPSVVGQSGKFLTNNGSAASWGNLPPAMISMTVPSLFVAASYPNAISLTLATQPKNTFFAGPVSGTNAIPTMRALSPMDFSADLMTLMRAKAPPAISNSPVDATNDIDIAAGITVTDAGTYIANVALTKRLDDAWVSGSNQGGLDAGTKAVATWYHVFLVYNPTTFAVDALFSTSATSPTLPSGFTEKRRIGAVRTNDAGSILSFMQEGDEFWWVSPITNFSTFAPNTSANLLAVTVPTGISIKAFLRGSSTNSGGAAVYRLITSPAVADAAPSLSAANIGGGTNAVDLVSTYSIRVQTNASAQIRHRSSSTNTAAIFVIQTEGWLDRRGRDD